MRVLCAIVDYLRRVSADIRGCSLKILYECRHGREMSFRQVPAQKSGGEHQDGVLGAWQGEFPAVGRAVFAEI